MAIDNRYVSVFFSPNLLQIRLSLACLYHSQANRRYSSQKSKPSSSIKYDLSGIGSWVDDTSCRVDGGSKPTGSAQRTSIPSSNQPSVSELLEKHDGHDTSPMLHALLNETQARFWSFGSGRGK